jgi:hypothetical protein
VARSPYTRRVGELLEAVPQRLEQHGDADRRDDREQRAAAMPGHRADAQHDPRVHGRERRRQQAVDHGPADDHVDVEQPVLQDPDRDRGREPEQPDEGRPGKRQAGDGWLLTVVRHDGHGRHDLDHGERRADQRDPVDLPPQLAAAGPVAQHE